MMPTIDESRDSEKNRDKVTQMLRRMLTAGDSALFRSCAVRATGKVGVGDAIPALIALLRDEDSDVRVDAATALGNLVATEATEATGVIRALVENIEGDPAGEVRIEAVKALGRIGSRDAVEPLIRCFEAEGYPELDQLAGSTEYGASFEVQRRALEALGKLGDGCAADVVPVVLKALANEDFEDMQEAGIDALARLDTGVAMKFLVGQLKSGNRLARRRAARALSSLPALRQESGGELSDGLLVPLVGALTDADPDVRVGAARALSGSGNPMVAVSLSLLLNDPDPGVRREIAALFSGMHGKAVLDRLHAMLAEPDPALRGSLAQVLGDIGDAASVAPLEALLDAALDAGERDLAFEAIRALGKIGARGPERKLAGILADGGMHHTVRAQAAWALGRLGRSVAPEAADPLAIDAALRRAVADPEERVAQAALSALVDMAPAGAVDDLAALVRGEPVGQAPQASPGPPTSAGPEAQTGLDELVAGQTPQTSTLAAILAAEGDRAPEAARAPAGTAGVSALRILAMRLLGGLDAPQAEKALLAASESTDASLRREAMQALGRRGGERAVAALVAGLDAEEKEVRLAAVDALCALDGEHAAGDRLLALLADPDPGVRVSVVRALGKGSGESASRGLCRALDDEHIQVCRAALSALSERTWSPACREGVLALMFRFGGDLRMASAATLRRLNDYDGVVDRLLEAVADQDRETLQWIAIDALGELYAVEAVQ